MRSRAKSQHAGRRDVTERIRELVALLGSLSRAGDSVTIDAISSRMGIPHEEAQTLMDIVCAASGEESGGLLISMNDEETAYTLQYTAVRGRPLRLTEPETVALVHALDTVGVEEDEPLRVRLNEAFGSREVRLEEVRQTLGNVLQSEQEQWYKTLQLCAQSQVDGRALVFMYQGLRDGAPRKRNAAVLRLANKEAGWYMDALDLDLGEQRTFRVEGMDEVELGDYVHASSYANVDEAQENLVTLHFHDPAYLTMFEWPGLRVIRERNGITTCTIPYYGSRSTWLPRRIIACGGTMVAEDEELMQRALHYACDLL